MSKIPLYLAYASWEDRFPLGVKRLLKKLSFKRAIIFFSAESKDLTARNREYVKNYFEDRDCSVNTVELTFKESVKNWKDIKQNIESFASKGDMVYVDISTMPRNVVFTVLYLLIIRRSIVNSVYHAPKHYSKSVLCRDASTPFLIYKLSGEFDLTKEGTVFIATVGFNPERVAMAIRHFEPLKVYLGFQKGNPYENIKKSVDYYNRLFGSSIKADVFEFDTYQGDAGFECIKKLVEDLKPDYNIIVGSFGPKRTAAMIFRVYLNGNQEIGFCYVPMKTYDSVYSTGIKETFIDRIN